MESWTVPDPDPHLLEMTVVDEPLALQMNHPLVAGSYPDWLTQGRMVLIMKGLIREQRRPTIGQ